MSLWQCTSQIRSFVSSKCPIRILFSSTLWFYIKRCQIIVNIDDKLQLILAAWNQYALLFPMLYKPSLYSRYLFSCRWLKWWKWPTGALGWQDHKWISGSYWSCFSDPLWVLDIFISSGHRHTFMNDVYITLYQPVKLFVLLQFTDTTCCHTKASQVGILAYINEDICHTTYVITFNISGWSLMICILSWSTHIKMCLSLFQTLQVGLANTGKYLL